MSKTLSEEHKKSIKNGMLKYFEDKGRTGTICKSGYKAITINGKREYEHRLVWKKYYGNIPKGFQVHHINGNKLDNRIENLKLISNSEHQKIHSKQARLGCDRTGIAPVNKTKEETILKIIDLRKKGFLLREICDFTKLSYPTVLKYAKEAI